MIVRLGTNMGFGIEPILEFVNSYGLLTLIVSGVVIPEVLNIRKRSTEFANHESNSSE